MLAGPWSRGARPELEEGTGTCSWPGGRTENAQVTVARCVRKLWSFRVGGAPVVWGSNVQWLREAVWEGTGFVMREAWVCGDSSAVICLLRSLNFLSRQRWPPEGRRKGREMPGIPEDPEDPAGEA